MNMREELETIGIHSTSYSLIDNYNQFILRPLGWYAKDEFTTIINHPANKKLKQEYDWKNK